jgi:hypothetical protein
MTLAINAKAEQISEWNQNDIVTLSAYEDASTVQVANIVWVSDWIEDADGIPYDWGWIDLLMAQGYTVIADTTDSFTTLDADKIATLEAADLIIVSRNINSDNYSTDEIEVNQWNSIKTPLILLNAYLSTSNRWQWLNTIGVTEFANKTMLAVVDGNHPVFTGVTMVNDQVDIIDENVNAGRGTFTAASDVGNGKLIAQRADNNNIWIAEWAPCLPFYEGTDQVPADKRMLFIAGGGGGQTSGSMNLTTEGRKMFINAVNYMLDRLGDCFPSCHEDYLEWIAAGKPQCWCNPRQCHGDADGNLEGSAQTGYYYVGPADMNILTLAWMVKEPPFGPGISSVPGGICVDFAHNLEGNSQTGFYRVGPSDLNILFESWMVKEPLKGTGIPADCLQYPYTSRPVSITQCLVVETQCPAQQTQCPTQDTRCPFSMTQCPAFVTSCPAKDTECPPSDTKCPVANTQCPTSATQCPPINTSCPSYVYTQCPVVNTQCPSSFTQCPPYPTECPYNYSICPYQPTQCPYNPTLCPYNPTSCPYLETECYRCWWQGVGNSMGKVLYSLSAKLCPAIEAPCLSISPDLTSAKTP